MNLMSILARNGDNTCMEASNKRAVKKEHISPLGFLAGVGFSGLFMGACKGYFDSQNIHGTPGLDNTLTYVPSFLGAISFGALGTINANRNYNQAFEHAEKGAMIKHGAVGAIAGGVLGVASTATGYGIGYTLGMFNK